MPGTRNRLINAARRSMLQRSELHRRLDVAKAAFKPRALVERGKYRVGEKVDDAAHIVRQEFRDNRLPIALAAIAGVAWLFREPIKEHVPRLAQKVQDLTAAALEKIRPDHASGADDDMMENDDEAAE
jgi:hypothetical protein